MTPKYKFCKNIKSEEEHRIIRTAAKIIFEDLRDGQPADNFYSA